ncbi:MAG: M12 family metallo-peptidase [Saprospiraceae bacterium]
MLKKSIFTILFVGLVFGVFAQDTKSLWKETTVLPPETEKVIKPSKFKAYTVDFEQLKQAFLKAPMEDFSNKSNGIVIWLPMPDGNFERFRVYEYSMMEQGLMAKFPNIKTYIGKGIDKPHVQARISINILGFNAVISKYNGKTVSINRRYLSSDGVYQVYFMEDYEAKKIMCHSHNEKKKLNEKEVFIYSGECQPKQYLLAVACTEEFADYHASTVPGYPVFSNNPILNNQKFKEIALSAVSHTINKVNEIFESEFFVRLKLVGNNDKILHTLMDPSPYTKPIIENVITNENITHINAEIGFSNYDIGQVFYVSSNPNQQGGYTNSQSFVCLPQKAGSTCFSSDPTTSSNNPIINESFLTIVIHEIGHQFGAQHTFNNSTVSITGDEQRNVSTAFEPGSGSTVMSYAGIWNSPYWDVQYYRDKYFHSINTEEIEAFIIDPLAGGQCWSYWEILPELNNRPFVDAGENFTIPKETPFLLTPKAWGDIDGDILTFCWEQMDNETTPDNPPQSNDNAGPLFRSFPPSDVPFRYFPKLDSLIMNILPYWEKLPSNISMPRNLNFWVTVRDGKCTNHDYMVVTVDTKGPFKVIQPNSDVLWSTGTKEKVKWQVASTNQLPVDCQFVDILLSTDGGYTYDKILASGVPNTGEYEIPVPDLITSSARVMVRASDNIFFDISDNDFEICSLLSDVEKKDVTCYNMEDCDGEIIINVAGGIPPYTYKWSTNLNGVNLPPDPKISKLCKGEYYVEVRDKNPKYNTDLSIGCKLLDTIEIKEPDEFKVFIEGGGFRNPCHPIELAAVLEGGTQPYEISWDGAPSHEISGNTDILPIVNPGFYQLNATDAHECEYISVSTEVKFLDVDCENGIPPDTPPDNPPYNPDGDDDDGDDGTPIFIRFINAIDPNEIVGPKGYNITQWVAKKDTLHFIIHYENDPEFATAPAQTVAIRQPVDSLVDLFSFRLGDFGFGDYHFTVPPNSLFYSNRLDLRDSLGIYVDVTAGIDVTTRELFWRLESIDPQTGLAPADPQAGFLPINDSLIQQGMGYVSYSIKASPAVVTGDSIHAKAEIIFDVNEPIPTNTWQNLVDAIAPQSHMNALPATSDTTRFQLSWSGQDDLGGVGVGKYDLYVSKNGSAFTPLIQGIDTTVFQFWGQKGNTYAFYTRATDYVGNKEPLKSQAEAMIHVEDALTEGLDIAIRQGWNMISSYVMPAMPAVLNILNPIASEVIIVKDGEGQVAVPSFGINSIGDWTITEGYQLKSLTDTVLTIRGLQVDPSQTPINIQSGWQIIAYLRDKSSGIEGALADIADKIVLVKNNEGNTYIPSFGINNIGNLVPTQGYQLRALDEAILVYAANDSLMQPPAADLRAAQAGFREVKAAQHFVREYPITGSNATIVLPKTVGDAMLRGGEEIGVFTEDGLICGTAVYEGTNLALTVWGDDPKTTYQKEGLVNGEPYLLKKWNQVTGKPELLSFDFKEGVPVYAENGYSILSAIEQTASSLDDPENLLLFNYYPQPASQKVHFQLALSEPSECRLDILNIEGKYEANIVEGTFSLYNFDYDVSGLTSGIYLMRLTINGQTKLYRLAVFGQ